MAHEGWSNYETWCVALWLDNDRGTYEATREKARECYAKIPDEFTTLEAGIELADYLKEMVTDAAPELDGMFADLLNAALSDVAWMEIAASMLCEMDCEKGE